MSSVHLFPVYDHFAAYLVEKATPREILAYQVPKAAQDRARELLERSGSGTLTPDEKTELEQMLQVDRFISVLKALAQEALNKS